MNPEGAKSSRQHKSDRLTLIDTSAWILTLRKEDSPNARGEVDRLIEKDLAATAGIVEMELLSGARTKTEYKELKEDLEALVQLEITRKTWDKASQLAYSLRRKGITVPSTDVLIATIVIENSCHLLHADHHFDLMAKQNVGLRPEAVTNLLRD